MSYTLGASPEKEAKHSRRAGRPRVPLLNRQLIIETALRLLDERGETGAGMRDVARELGVQPSALYNHVAGREDLTAGIRELVSDRIDVECFEMMTWDQALVQWAKSYRDAFAAHPPTIALLATTPLAPDSRTSVMYNTVVSALVRGGWDRDRALSVIVAVESFVLGAALDAAANPAMMDPGPRDDVPEFTESFIARGNRLAEAGVSTADDAYHLGISALVVGLRAELEATGK